MRVLGIPPPRKGETGSTPEGFHHTPNLLPQAIGRKTPDKRNRHALMRMYHAYMLRTIASEGAFSTAFMKASYHQSPEHIQIPLHIRGDGVETLSPLPTINW